MSGNSRSEEQCPQGVREASGAAQTVARRQITSTELFGNSRDIQILHAGSVYTLRRTSKGKLILTK
jgi:hemin uptake protein HemP